MVYVDSNLFIYAAIGLPEDSKTVQSRIFFTKIASGKILASTSVLTWDEVIWVCRKSLPPDLTNNVGNSFFSLPNLELKDVNKAIVLKASDLVAQHNLRPRDAIHAATAILNGEKEIISDDSDFDKVKELIRISLAEAAK